MPHNGTPVPRCPEFNSTYQKRCRCDFCRKVATRRKTLGRLRDAERERGKTFPTDRVDPTQARELVRRAVDSGVSYMELERITGLQRLALQKLYHARTKTITRDTHQRVVKTMSEGDVRAFVDSTPVPAKWTRQMIYSLLAQGWSCKKQAELLQHNLGCGIGFISSVRTGKYECVYYGNEQAIRWLVNEIGDARGPSKRSAQWAARHGHFPTKHYDSNGDLIVSSLPKEKRRAVEGV